MYNRCMALAIIINTECECVCVWCEFDLVDFHFNRF